MALEQLDDSTSVESNPYDPYSPLALATLTDKHVAETVRLVSESSVCREAWAAGRDLAVHGWVYHVATAKLRDLNIGLKGGEDHFFSFRCVADVRINSFSYLQLESQLV